MEWPYSCRYFVPEIMDPESVLDLFDCDAEFHASDSNTLDVLAALNITKTGSRPCSLSSSKTAYEDNLRIDYLKDGDSCVIFVPQMRLYPRDSTYNAYGVKRTTWMQILLVCDILPAAIELLHDNNGGWAVHTSYCSDVKGSSCGNKSSATAPGISQCAYHIWMKPQHWWNEEHFVYARHDFHSGKNFLLVAGTSINTQLQRLLSQFNSVP